MANRILEVLHYAVWIFALIMTLLCVDHNSNLSWNLQRVMECLVTLFGILIIPAPFWYIVAKKWYLLPWQHKDD